MRGVAWKWGVIVGKRTRAAGTATSSVVALLGGVDEDLAAVHHVAAHLHCLRGTLQVREADVGKATWATVLLVVCCSKTSNIGKSIRIMLGEIACACVCRWLSDSVILQGEGCEKQECPH